MNPYEKVFQRMKEKKHSALIAFVVLGDPTYNKSLKIIKTLVDSGVDCLELGLPFSDPIADGKTIQKAGQRALSNGMNTNKAFEIVKKIRKFSLVPIGLFSYSNLVYSSGINHFYDKAKNCGVDSVLIPDLPIEESKPFIDAARKNNLCQVFLASHNSANGRIKKISQKSSGFLYLTSVTGVTGARKDLDKKVFELINRAKKNSTIPLCVGFGISSVQHVKAIKKTKASGMIVGSSIISLIEKNLDNEKKMLTEISDFVKELKSTAIAKDI